jgi:hypothetical protein
MYFKMNKLYLDRNKNLVFEIDLYNYKNIMNLTELKMENFESNINFLF